MELILDHVQNPLLFYEKVIKKLLVQPVGYRYIQI